MNSITTGGENYSAKVAADPEGRDAAAEGVAAAGKYLKPVPPYAQAIIAASKFINRISTTWQEREMEQPYRRRRAAVGAALVALMGFGAVESGFAGNARDALRGRGVSSVYDEFTNLCRHDGGTFEQDRYSSGKCPLVEK